MATTSPLRQRMIKDMTIRNLAQATQQFYIYAVRKFSRHFGKSPARLGVEDVPAYQLHLIAEKRSWSYINQTACSLRFFYGVTLGQQEAFERIVNGREPEKLPPILTPEEIARFSEAVAGLRNRVALTTAYAAGLRIGEVCRLKAASIESKRILTHVEGGEGAKDRYAMLSPRLLDILRAYRQRAHPGLWLFPGREPGDHVSIAALQDACRVARRKVKRQAGRGPLPTAQLCDTSSGKWRRASHHPGAARAFRAGVEDTLRAARYSFDRQHPEPLRPALARGRAVRIAGRPAPEAGGGGHLPSPRRQFSRRARQPALPRSTLGHGRDRGLPDAGARRSALISSAARIVARLASPTIPVATGTARSARVWRASNSSPTAAPNCCPSPISMLSSP
jgi:integrase/recombinase XerD